VTYSTTTETSQRQQITQMKDITGKIHPITATGGDKV